MRLRDAASRPAGAGAAGRVRRRGRPLGRAVPGGGRHAVAADRGGRGEPRAVRRRRRPLARPRHRGRAAVLRPPARCGPGAPGVLGPRRGRDAVRRPTASTSWCWPGSTRTRPGPCSTSGWATRRRPRSPTGSSPRRAATRWPCSSCPPSSAPTSSAGPPPLPPSCTSPPGSSRPSSTAADGCRHRCSRVLLLAAADDTGDLAVVRARGVALGARRARSRGRGRLRAAGRRRGDACQVRHPLVRSAIYQAATAAQRRQRAPGPGRGPGRLGDADREAWHRAAAAEGPDPDVVAALELVGARAERRGAYVAALAAYERAAALLDRRRQRAELTLRGRPQRLGLRAGRPRTRPAAPPPRAAADPVLLGDIARLRGHIEVNLGSATDAHRIFVDAAHAVREIDPSEPWRWPSLAAIMRTYGADSGTPLQAERHPRRRPRRTTLRGPVPQADAGRDDPGRRRRLGSGGRRAGPRPASR